MIYDDDNNNDIHCVHKKVKWLVATVYR